MVSRNVSPAWRASAAWSMTANSLIPFAVIMPVSLATVAATDSRLSLVTTSASGAAGSSIMVNVFSSGVLRPCLRGERIHAEVAPGQARSRSSPAGRSWGAPHRGVPELLDGRVDQLVIA